MALVVEEQAAVKKEARGTVHVWVGSAASTVADKPLFVGCSTAYSKCAFFQEVANCMATVRLCLCELSRWQ